MDHDRNFKELLTHFFVEFADLFLPDIALHLDRSIAVVPLDKEVFTDVAGRDRHEVDLVMKARFRDEDAFFLVHFEHQSTVQGGFPKRMFRYYVRLTAKYDLPVYPVVIFSHDQPYREEPSLYEEDFRGKPTLRFWYTVIQLNRLSWRDFVQRENPVASALMAKMRMSVAERPKVRAECLRLLSRLKLDPARSTLIGVFIESYLRLNADEMRQYEREIEQFAPDERKSTMELVTSWQLKGREEGRVEGKERLVILQIRRRFGDVTESFIPRIDRLNSDQLDALGEALLDFKIATDLDVWLTRTQPN